MRRAALCVAVVALAAGAPAADEEADLQIILDAVNDALEHRKTGETVPWTNLATGARGTITVETTFFQPDGTPCRTYVRTLETGDPELGAIRGTACRTEIGFWMLDETGFGPSPASSAPETR